MSLEATINTGLPARFTVSATARPSDSSAAYPPKPIDTGTKENSLTRHCRNGSWTFSEKVAALTQGLRQRTVNRDSAERREPRALGHQRQRRAPTEVVGGQDNV